MRKWEWKARHMAKNGKSCFNPSLNTGESADTFLCNLYSSKPHFFFSQWCLCFIVQTISSLIDKTKKVLLEKMHTLPNVFFTIFGVKKNLVYFHFFRDAFFHLQMYLFLVALSNLTNCQEILSSIESQCCYDLQLIYISIHLLVLIIILKWKHFNTPSFYGYK